MAEKASRSSTATKEREANGQDETAPNDQQQSLLQKMTQMSEKEHKKIEKGK